VDEFFERYQILIDRLNLPDRVLPKVLTICQLSDRNEYERVLSLFLKLFPDEIDSEKASELRQLQIPQFEGNFIAKINQEIVGFLISGIINQVGYISYLGVKASLRSQGIATGLLREFKAYLNKNNVKKIRCTIRKDNKKTLGYIHFLGFKQL